MLLHLSVDELAPPRDLLVKEASHNDKFVNVSLFWSPPCRPAAMASFADGGIVGRREDGFFFLQKKYLDDVIGLRLMTSSYGSR